MGRHGGPARVIFFVFAIHFLVYDLSRLRGPGFQRLMLFQGCRVVSTPLQLCCNMFHLF